MKTKLTLLTVLAFALFAGGCVSSNLPVPDGGLDLKGSGMMRPKGEKIRISIERVASGSVRGSASMPRQGTQSGSGSFTGSSETFADIEVSNASDGVTSELKISNIIQDEKLKSRMSGSLFTGAGKPDGSSKGPLHGKEFTLKISEGGSWRHPFGTFRGFLGNPTLFPEDKMSIGGQWHRSDFMSSLVREMPESRPGGATMPNLEVKADFKFKALKEFKGERCAVIAITIPRTTRTVDGARISIYGNGIIYRSLDSYRNLKGQVKGNMSVYQSQKHRTPAGTASVSMNMSASYKINEKEEVISKPEPPKVP